MISTIATETEEQVGCVDATYLLRNLFAPPAGPNSRTVDLERRRAAVQVVAAQCAYFAGVGAHARPVPPPLFNGSMASEYLADGREQSTLSASSPPPAPPVVGVIGCGQVGSAILDALLSLGWPPHLLGTCARTPSKWARFEKLGVQCTTQAEDFAQWPVSRDPAAKPGREPNGVRVVVLAVPHAQLRSVTALLTNATARGGGASGLSQCLVVSCVAGVGMAKLRQLLGEAAPWVCRTRVELGKLAAGTLQPSGAFPHLVSSQVNDAESSDTVDERSRHESADVDRYGDRSVKDWEWPGLLSHLPSQPGMSHFSINMHNGSYESRDVSLSEMATGAVARTAVEPPPFLSSAVLQEAAVMLASHAPSVQAAIEGLFCSTGFEPAEARRASLAIALGIDSDNGDESAVLGLANSMSSLLLLSGLERGASQPRAPPLMRAFSEQSTGGLWLDDGSGGGGGSSEALLLENERRAGALSTTVAACAELQASRVLPHFHAAFAKRAL